MMKKIAIVGSINADLVVETDISPKKGETVIGNHFFTSPGGKGANQAVAAARLGGTVSMFGTVGKDENGRFMKENLQKENIDTSHLQEIEGVSTGVAIIELSENDNRIIVVSGANHFTKPDYIEKIKQELLEFDVILMQLEIPLEAIECLIDFLYEHKKKIILNPAPAMQFKQEVLDKITYITPNEHEYKLVLNTQSDLHEALKEYPNKLIITQGEKGVSYFDGEDVITVPCLKATAVDTTGAGDTFSGAFGVAISENYPLNEAITFANIAAGLSVTKKGAQGGMPARKEVIDIYHSKGGSFDGGK